MLKLYRGLSHTPRKKQIFSSLDFCWFVVEDVAWSVNEGVGGGGVAATVINNRSWLLIECHSVWYKWIGEWMVTVTFEQTKWFCVTK